MKYNRDQVKRMTPHEYEEIMCKELSKAGFQQEFHGEKLDYSPDESTFGGGVVFDLEAVEYLKQIGLLNNGKCPMCSTREDRVEYRLQHQNGADYHVCKNCYKEYATQERQKRGCACCLGVLFILGAVCYGILKLIGTL